MRTSPHLLCQKNFSAQGKDLRAQFDSAFAKPTAADRRRFCWDYWHVPDQYTLLRTPAWEFISAESYRRLHLELIQFGQQNFGCHNITPPWLSLYVEGCSQNLHADVPHGPWAFVYSLTNWKQRRFSGGETFILRPETLEYWQNMGRRKGHDSNRDDLALQVPAEFNQLLVFDPRLPHGVNEVRGVKDPLEGRLVVHGWYTDPAPFVEGGLEIRQKSTGTALNEALAKIEATGFFSREVSGSLVIKLNVAKSGKVESTKLLRSTLKPLGNESAVEAQAAYKQTKQMLRILSEHQFPLAKAKSTITLPITYA